MDEGLRDRVRVAMLWADFRFLLEDFERAMDIYLRIQRETDGDRNKTVYTRAVMGEMMARAMLGKLNPERDTPRMFDLVRENPRSPPRRNRI